MKHLREILWCIVLGFVGSCSWHFAKWLISSEYISVYLAIFATVMLPITYFAYRKFKEWIMSSEGN